MFVAIQAIICTFMFVVFVSEAVIENHSAPCFLKKTHERIRVNRAISEDATSFNLEILKKGANSTEKESPILIKSLNSGQIEEENGSSSDNESSKAKVTDSVKLILNPVNSTEEENSRKKKSSHANLTDFAQIMQFSHNEKTENKENTSREKELQNANLTDFADMIMKSLNLETKRNVEENWTEVESFIEILKNSSNISEIIKVENLTGNNSLKANLAHFVREENSTEKELENHNTTDSEQIITKTVNSKGAKIEEEKLEDKESNLKNLTIFAQKSSSKGQKPKVRRRITEDPLSENEKDKAGRAFLTAYDKCKLLKNKHFIRMLGPNGKETTKCVLRELKKLETYPNEFIQYLENKEIVRKA